MTETVDVEATEELVFRPDAPAPPPTLFNTDDPNLIIAKAASVADALKRVITNQKMSVRIGQSDYIKVEGWTTLGALLGVFTKVESTKPLMDTRHAEADGGGADIGWEAAVVVVNNQGVEIGRAEAQCLRAEKNWKSRDDFALRSMAQTRAMGKALRMVLGWIAVMAGYEATPAEEMPTDKSTVAGREVSDDVPFDDTGGAQGRESVTEHGANTQQGTTGTGAASTTREEANERRRLELTDRLCRAAGQLGKLRVTEDAIEKDRQKKKLPAHLSWLETQLAAAEAAVAQQELEV